MRSSADRSFAGGALSGSRRRRARCRAADVACLIRREADGAAAADRSPCPAVDERIEHEAQKLVIIWNAPRSAPVAASPSNCVSAFAKAAAGQPKNVAQGRRQRRHPS